MFRNTIQASILGVSEAMISERTFLCTAFISKSYLHIVLFPHKTHLQFLRSFNNVQIKKAMFILVTPTEGGPMSLDVVTMSLIRVTSVNSRAKLFDDFDD